MEPERKHVRMLQEKQVVVATSVVQGALKRVRLAVGDPAKPANAEHVSSPFLVLGLGGSRYRGLLVWVGLELGGPVMGGEDLGHSGHEGGRVGAVHRPVIPRQAQ